MPIVIGVAGGTGSGKTTVARTISSHFQGEKVALLEQDFYYRDMGHLPMEERRRVNYDHPDAFDTDLLVSHIRSLKANMAVDKPDYSFDTYSRLSTTTRVEPGPIIVVEGIMALAVEELRRHLDIRIFVDADADVRFIRRAMRDMKERGRTMDSVVEQYLTVVRPMHLQFVEPSKRYADVIIPEGGHNSVAIDLLVTKMLSAMSTPSMK